ncbi:hypothetical protein PAEPH01_2180 [Pancytospora epiphaga]|nr:hypothetical protein PAEPH01_2180 [Pancytospora epiphaga]
MPALIGSDAIHAYPFLLNQDSINITLQASLPYPESQPYIVPAANINHINNTRSLQTRQQPLCATQDMLVHNTSHSDLTKAATRGRARHNHSLLRSSKNSQYLYTRALHNKRNHRITQCQGISRLVQNEPRNSLQVSTELFTPVPNSDITIAENIHTTQYVTNECIQITSPINHLDLTAEQLSAHWVHDKHLCIILDDSKINPNDTEDQALARYSLYTNIDNYKVQHHSTTTNDFSLEESIAGGASNSSALYPIIISDRPKIDIVSRKQTKLKSLLPLPEYRFLAQATLSYHFGRNIPNNAVLTDLNSCLSIPNCMAHYNFNPSNFKTLDIFKHQFSKHFLTIINTHLFISL